jgi:uncharacterized membrane protein
VSVTASTTAAQQAWRGRTVLSGLLTGVGIAAFLDEVVFHQLLQWHHLYDGSTPAVGIFSDGLFHAFGTTALVVGLFLYADVQRRRALVARRWAGAVVLGWGVFQLYDGLVQHKVLGLHQVRYGVELWPYDLAWNGAAGAGIVIGALLLRRAAAASARPLARDR